MKGFYAQSVLLLLVVVALLFSCKNDKGEDTDPDFEPAGGLLIHYDFSGNATDRSEFGYNGKIIGSPQTVESRQGRALRLNETDGNNGCNQLGGEYVQMPIIGKVWENGFSVVAWVEFQENRNYERILDMGNGLGETNGRNITFSRNAESNDLVLTSWINADSVYNRIHGRLVARNAIVNGELQQYAATISPEGVMRIFVNGTKVAERTDGHAVLNITRERNYVGHSSYCYLDPDLKGVVDDFRIYNVALEEKDIEDLYISH